MVSTVHFFWLFVWVLGSKIFKKRRKLLILKKICQTKNMSYIINRSRFILFEPLIFSLMHTRSGCIQLIDLKISLKVSIYKNKRVAVFLTHPVDFSQIQVKNVNLVLAQEANYIKILVSGMTTSQGMTMIKK